MHFSRINYYSCLRNSPSSIGSCAPWWPTCSTIGRTGEDSTKANQRRADSRRRGCDGSREISQGDVTICGAVLESFVAEASGRRSAWREMSAGDRIVLLEGLARHLERRERGERRRFITGRISLVAKVPRRRVSTHVV